MTWSASATRTGTAQHKTWAHAVKQRDHYQCQRCGYQGTPGKGDVEADHIHNTARGGTDTLANGLTLCRPCHRAKTQQEAAAGRRQHSPKRKPEPHPGLI